MIEVTNNNVSHQTYNKNFIINNPEWDCRNKYLKKLMTSSIKSYSPNVDEIQRHITETLEDYLKTSNSSWLIMVGKVVRSVSYIDYEVKDTEWFCSVYDNTSNIQIHAIRVYTF
uniref:Dynein light chain n=1 Tax=Strongyloides papillosus TaxID=174720 RepID=A0A0N5C1F6_STREA